MDYLLKPLSADWDGFSAKAHEFIAQGDRVVSLGTYSGTLKKQADTSGRSESAGFEATECAPLSTGRPCGGVLFRRDPPRKTIEAEIWFAVPAYAISADFVVKVVC